MESLRKIVNSDILEGIIQLPEHLKHRNVEIYIKPTLEPNEDEDDKSQMFANLCGLWEGRDPDEITLDMIRDNAWQRR